MTATRKLLPRGCLGLIKPLIITEMADTRARKRGVKRLKRKGNGGHHEQDDQRVPR